MPSTPPGARPALLIGYRYFSAPCRTRKRQSRSARREDAASHALTAAGHADIMAPRPHDRQDRDTRRRPHDTPPRWGDVLYAYVDALVTRDAPVAHDVRSWKASG